MRENSDIARDMRQDGAPEGGEVAATPHEGDAVPAQTSSWIWQAITGEILVSPLAKKFYALLLLIGVIFFLSIATIFASLRADLRRSELESEVEALTERAIRTTEQLHQATSHSAIVRRLKERGIDMRDPQTQPKILK